MNEFEKLKLASCDLLGIAWGSLLPVTRFIIYYIDPKKLHKHFGHFGSPKFRRESERERRTGRRERERERERERGEILEGRERERIVIPARCAISGALLSIF